MATKNCLFNEGRIYPEKVKHITKIYLITKIIIHCIEIFRIEYK